MWFQGGASGVPSYFQFPIHYGNFEVPNQFEKGFYIPYGEAMHLADVQGGMTQVKQPEGSLSRVTGSAGNDIFRGHRLPDALKGQLFYGEPVARIVRQINPENKEGLTVLSNVYQKMNLNLFVPKIHFSVRSTWPLPQMGRCILWICTTESFKKETGQPKVLI